MGLSRLDINPFAPNALFLYPLKTENLMFSGGGGGEKKGCIGNKCINEQKLNKIFRTHSTPTAFWNVISSSTVPIFLGQEWISWARKK